MQRPWCERRLVFEPAASCKRLCSTMAGCRGGMWPQVVLQGACCQSCGACMCAVDSRQLLVQGGRHASRRRGSCLHHCCPPQPGAPACLVRQGACCECTTSFCRQLHDPCGPPLFGARGRVPVASCEPAGRMLPELRSIHACCRQAAVGAGAGRQAGQHTLRVCSVTDGGLARTTAAITLSACMFGRQGCCACTASLCAGTHMRMRV